MADGILRPYIKSLIQAVPKLLVQIITGGREHKNKYISLWYIWSLTAISYARDDLHRRQVRMLITAVEFTELLECANIGLYARSTSSDHWFSCPFEDSRHVRNGTSSDGNSSDEIFVCFHNGVIHQVTWPHVSGFLPLGLMKQLLYDTVVET